jgi:ABC-2 type transport system ATP-binding protein
MMGTMTSGVPAIEVTGLSKAYGSLAALRGVDFSVGRGEVFGLLGPNGAGKTTTVEVLEGYRERDSGSVRVLGCEPGARELRTRVGIVLQSCGTYPHLTVRETVTHWASFYPAPRRVVEVLALAGLDECADRRARTLSGGQARRLDFALALVGDPELIFLDEPTTGFDPAARRQSWETIANLRTLGKSVLLTTHYMEEAQYLADRVVVIAKGRIVAQGTPDELVRDDASTLVTFREPAYHESLPLPEGATVERGLVSFRTTTPTRDLAPLLEWAASRGMELEHLTVTRPTLEDVYLDLTATEEVAA